MKAVDRIDQNNSHYKSGQPRAPMSRDGSSRGSNQSLNARSSGKDPLRGSGAGANKN